MSRIGGRAAPLLAGLAVGAVVFVALGAGGGHGHAPRPAAPLVASVAPPGRAIFVRMGCGSCHRLAAAGSQGTIGPNLDQGLKSYTRQALISQIIKPYGGGQSPGTMPSGFGKLMSRAELNALVDFLLAARRQ